MRPKSGWVDDCFSRQDRSSDLRKSARRLSSDSRFAWLRVIAKKKESIIRLKSHIKFALATRERSTLSFWMST